jgi:tRNA pseudouridine13 synthase
MLSDFERAPGVIKSDYIDFQVEELPLYSFSGQGDHTYFLVEKAGLGTMQAVNDLADALNIRRVDIGYAGLKDARAITRQWMSVEHIAPEKIKALNIPRMAILDVTRHSNKLKLGHLRGNRFTIHVRDTSLERLAELQDAMDILAKRGVPNYFGEQRFGDRGDNAVIGAHLLRGELEPALDLVLGAPIDSDHGKVRQARELYSHGHYEQAMKLWPGMYRNERRSLKILTRGGTKRKAFGTLDRNHRKFYISAFQSALFNQVLAQRVERGLDQLMAGDLAWIHENGAVFRVDDLAAEQPRCAAFEISPSGPLYGPRMSNPTGEPYEIETKVWADSGVPADALQKAGIKIAGGRRAMRFRPEEPGIRLGADPQGPYFEVFFTLPRGCYATTLLRELFEPRTVRVPTPSSKRRGGRRNAR